MVIPPNKPAIHKGRVAETVSSPQLPKPTSMLSRAGPSFTLSPTFPAAVYDALPRILMKGCSLFEGQREKDVFLLSSIVVLSSCMSAVRGIYDGSEVQANLFAFVVAPASSGKGTLSSARTLVAKLHKHRTELSEQAKKEHEIKAAEARADKQPIPEPPPYKTLIIPGNTSSAAIIKALKDNDSSGLVCETEADSLSGALSQEWGDFSDLIRKSFHHEVISCLRKSGERYEIECPALSILLAGTPGQVSKLIPNAENGLFSRFLFYRYETLPVWRDVSPVSGRPSLNMAVGALAEEVKTMALHLERLGEVSFELTPSQWRVFNSFCQDWLETAIDDTGKAISGTVYRLGLIIYRLTMVLSVLRCYDTNSLSETSIVCQDDTFNTAIELAKVLLEHSKIMYDEMPKTNGQNVGTSNLQKFLAALPTDFDRKYADSVGSTMKVTERSITNYLRRLTISGQVTKTEHGKYCKV